MSKAFEAAVRYLAGREHSRHELSDKLQRKGLSFEETESALEECRRLNLQSDERYMEMLCQARIRQGWGPLRIRQELGAKKIDPSLVDAFLQSHEAFWPEYALNAWRKKFRNQQPCSASELQKQQRFLQYRGFPVEIIAKLLNKQPRP